jgi:hypothetical protein
MPVPPTRYRLALMAALGLIATGGCARNPTVQSAAIPAIPPGDARIWIYRAFIPSDSLNIAQVSINGALAGYAQAAGGAFYRDVAPGPYHVAVESYGRDFNQSANLALAAGQQAYIRIESLSDWTSGGDLTSFKRDTFYARLVDPDRGRAEVERSTFDGGS